MTWEKRRKLGEDIIERRRTKDLTFTRETAVAIGFFKQSSPNFNHVVINVTMMTKAP